MAGWQDPAAAGSSVATGAGRAALAVVGIRQVDPHKRPPALPSSRYPASRGCAKCIVPLN